MNSSDTPNLIHRNLLCPWEEKKVRDTIYIHYGSNSFDPGRVKKPTSIKDWDEGIFKPKGSLWACRVDSDYSWKEWCEGEEFHLDRLDKSFTFTLSPLAKILEIHQEADLMPFIIGFNMFHRSVIDIEKIFRMYDGMELFITENWEELRYGHFYSWDVDSIAIWNPSVVEVISDDRRTLSA